MPDDLTAELARIRERAEYAKEYMQGDPMPLSLDDVPRLLAAVDVALGHHVPAGIGDMPEPRFRYCSTCSGKPAWPCPEVAAITRALNGESSD